MSNLNPVWAALIVEELVRHGVEEFVISPGSRSTPLTAAIANHPKARSIVHFDERGAAFYALGYARGKGKPAPLICTSGTAVANYIPAFIEAAQDSVPMLVISADRPPELIHCGANQAIDQQGIFGRYARKERQLPCPDSDIPPQMVLQIVDELYADSLNGPVHLNCQYRKPLDPREWTEDDSKYLECVSEWRSGSEPLCATQSATQVVPESLIQMVAEAEKGYLVVGRLDSDEDREAIRQLSKRLAWPLIADITSGLRLGAPERCVAFMDQLLLSDEWQVSAKADLILQVGGQLVSQRVGGWLGAQKGVPYVQVNSQDKRIDANHQVTMKVTGSISALISNLASSIENPLLSDLLTASKQVAELVRESATEIAEWSVVHQLSRLIPASHALWSASSLSIRFLDMFGDPNSSPVCVGSNRGASGIDGTIASACGYARGTGKPVTLLIGDLALLHDLNSLALLKDHSPDVRIVLLNNNGGAIFNFLPISKQKDVFKPYWETPHNLPIADIIKGFGINCVAVASLADFTRAYESDASIIEVVTDPAETLAATKELQAKLVKPHVLC